ncbi:CHAD domain-containing protein [Roseomonas sp. HJA6]|uniref:CHAD domain-containing protein n=1 Tax=Roseomonas alba TaxID=2846776 RepID=A0ABS7A7A4_9PROT|nr:CHAD domain-containing protein [Neoroseomonas alba]MBW6398171.1 CHAD domain-containing protein [Neoroseomonas alba]
MSSSNGRVSRAPLAEQTVEPPQPTPAPVIEVPPAHEPVSLEFDLPPDAAGRLGRLPAIAALRQGRARGAAAAIMWYDSADGRLAAEGLVVEAASRGPRRLLRMLPEEAAAWHPGCPPRLLRQLAADEVPEEAATDALAAFAAFAGRQQGIRLDTEHGPVQLILLEGRLRSVAAERPAARLTLTGTLDGVLAVARIIAAELPLLPPLAALAEEGRALAANQPARPYRLGAPDTSAATTAEDAFVIAAGHLLEVLRQQSARIRADSAPEPVHQTRVALRRLRSVFRVFRTVTDCAALRGIDARLREVLAVLGPARDWDVFLGGIVREVETAFPDDKRIAGLRRAAEAQKKEAYAAVLAMLAGPAWRLLFIDAVGLLLTRPWRDAEEEARLAALTAPVENFGRSVLARRWQRLRRAGDGFEGLNAEELHELRLDGKRLRYAAEVFAPVFGIKAGRRFLRRVAALQDGLGLANDAAVARGLAAKLAKPGDGGRAWAVGVVEGWSEARVAANRNDAREAWERLHGKDRFWSDE